jgi:hypothetical protein
VTDMQIYVRLLTELHPRHGDRSALRARSDMQDILCELRDRAAVEIQMSDEETENEAESQAFCNCIGRSHRYD